MPSAFFTALSGLRSHQAAVQVVANNVANLNTVAFKGSRADFRDLFYQNIGLSRSGVASQIGLGVSPITVSRRFEQGTIQNTGGCSMRRSRARVSSLSPPTVCCSSRGRATFSSTPNQELVTINGEIVQGWNRDPSTGAVNTQPADWRYQPAGQRPHRAARNDDAADQRQPGDRIGDGVCAAGAGV